MKLELLTYATVVDDAIRFISDRSKDKEELKLSVANNDSEHDKEESDEPDYDDIDQLEEEQVLYARGLECDEKISKLSEEKMKEILEEVRKLRRKNRRLTTVDNKSGSVEDEGGEEYHEVPYIQ